MKREDGKEKKRTGGRRSLHEEYEGENNEERDGEITLT